ncbi:MAG: hypothetical protein IJQ25_04300 [Oscillibacter sp.]|nr:hypothetical protein [Oscillibacter sp.]
MNREQKILGYELFYRNSSGNAARITDDDVATRKVLTDANTLFGLLELTNGRPAFITFTRNLILDDFVREADPEIVLVQVDSGKIQRIDQRLELKLRALKDAGYALVLKNYTGQRHLHDFMYLFDIVRVNFGGTNSPLQKDLRYNHGMPKAKFIADRLENSDSFYQALKMNYHYFQGYYWGKPEMISIPIPPIAETAYGKILGILSRVRDSDVNWSDVKCAEIIRGHLLLSYLFLREMNAILPPPPWNRRSRMGHRRHRARRAPHGAARPAALALAGLHAA